MPRHYPRLEKWFEDHFGSREEAERSILRKQGQILPQQRAALDWVFPQEREEITPARGRRSVEAQLEQEVRNFVEKKAQERLAFQTIHVRGRQEVILRDRKTGRFTAFKGRSLK